MLRTMLLGALVCTFLATRTGPATAQTPDSMMAAARFVGVMSVVVPACGARDRGWGMRLALQFVDAVNSLSPELVRTLPARQLPAVLDALNQAQRDGRSAYAANRAAVCAGNDQPERLRFSDSLIEGTRRFW